ncbi:MAG: DUF4405 domain-containing protein [Oligoflexales bacterium]|nr:DUF4405 domain-containing protein [Oligoflexales bacterium]
MEHKNFFKRSWVSLLTALFFVIVSTSGIIMLFHIKAGGVKELHEVIGVLFAVFGVIHLIFNWKALLSYLKSPRPLAVFILAAILCVAIFHIVSGEEHQKRDRERNERREHCRE